MPGNFHCSHISVILSNCFGAISSQYFFNGLELARTYGNYNCLFNMVTSEANFPAGVAYR